MFNENTWKNGELIAQKYMKMHGYKILYTNFSCVGVELDIVAILPKKVQCKQLKIELKNKIKENKNRKNTIKILKNRYKIDKKQLNDILIVAEVKARSNDNYGEGVFAINGAKINHIRRGGEFLLQNSRFADMQIRFDVVSIDGEKINYIENAF